MHPPRARAACLVALGLQACSETPSTPLPRAQAQHPRVVATDDELTIRAHPRPDAKRLGAVRLGGAVRRGPEAVGWEGCAGGWFDVVPRGFACASEGALEAPAALTSLRSANRSAVLPYRYARVRRGGGVRYAALPSPMAQRLREPDGTPEAPADRRLRASAIDVPRDEAGLPTGPPVIEPDAAGVGADGYRTRRGFFDFDGQADPPALGVELSPPSRRPIAQRIAELFPEATGLRRRTVIPMVASFDVPDGEDSRSFALSPTGDFVPTDQLEPVLGSTWHGIDVREKGLPVAFALRRGVRPRVLRGGRAEVLDDEYEPRHPIPLTGRFRTVAKERYYFTRDNRWVRHRDLIIVHRRHTYPDFAAARDKWIDVSLANQYLVAYEGKKPVYATLISSGRKRLGDPAMQPATPRGVFQVVGKHLSRDIDNREVKRRYALHDIPYVVETSGDFALCSGLWLSRFGQAQGHRDIALPPVDAAWLFRWVTPAVPSGWHSVAVDEGEGPPVYVHK